MIKEVIKRDGSKEKFESIKIANSIHKVMKDIGEDDFNYALQISDDIIEDLIDELLDVTEVDSESFTVSIQTIDDSIEEYLMTNDLHKLAKAYILYRDKKESMQKPDIFKPRKQYRPFEYTSLHKYVDAIRGSYWTHDEFDYTADVHDFKMNMSEKERESVRRCMLAISHIEATVKTFWTKLGDRFPKPEIAEVGVTMGESEVRHANAYAEVLNLLGLNEEFKSVMEVPVIDQRQKYMDEATSGKTGSNQDYMESVLLFSLFIENVSLFSQFLIIMTINKEKGYLKGLSNAISATALEENLHAMLGADIIKILREEHPEWFTEELNARVKELVHMSYTAERDIIEWIFEYGEIESITKREVIEYIKSRYNKGLEDAGFNSEFDINEELLENTEFFDIQISTTGHTDFFNQRSVNYTKKSAVFDEDSLF